MAHSFYIIMYPMLSSAKVPNVQAGIRKFTISVSTLIR